MTFAEFSDFAGLTREKLVAARKSIGSNSFDWYPYDSLTNLLNLERAFGTRYLPALDCGSGRLVADIGCGDGELSFLLESLGCQVDAIDFPDANHNHMLAIRALKRELCSQINIHEVDLDSQFKLPRPRYDLVIFLGVLYHIKNPFYVMEKISKSSRYCVMSTRVARNFPDGSMMPRNQPIAYLVGEEELNRDPSNFWIFSHRALRRLLERTNWNIVEYVSLGDRRFSDPVHAGRDERVFCLLESRCSLATVDLLHGWHEPEAHGVRWTMKQFCARINLATRAGADRLSMRVYVPDDLLARLGPRRLDIAIDGEPAAPVILDRPGYHDIVRRFHSRGHRSILVSFEVDGALPPDAQDPRERALVIHTVDVE